MTRYSIAMLKVTTAIALMGCFALAIPEASAQKAGVAAAVNADANRTPPGAARREIVLGDEIVFNERIDTDAAGQAQVLMLDRTALSIGPNASLIIDKFVYDPDKKTGDMALTLRRGLMRFVGGNISKTQRVQVKTPVGVLGVRGGIALFEVLDDNTVDATFLFGDDLVMLRDGQEIGRITTPGYSSRVTQEGAGTPQKVTPQQIAQKMGQLQGRAGASGGLSETPNAEEVSSQTETMAASNDAGATTTTASGTGTSDGQGDLTKNISDSQNLVVEGNEEPVVALETNDFVGVVRRYDNMISTLSSGVNTTSDIEGSFTVFNNGDEIYSLFSPGTPESVLEGPAFEFLSNGDGPDLILNPFDPSDLALYSRPETAFDALVTAGMDPAAARIVVGPEIYQDDFVHLTYRELLADDIHDNRITITAGTPFTNFPSTGVWSYETGFDPMRYSRFLFSAVNTVELHTGSRANFLTNTFQLGTSASQTPLFIDWAHGKVFYASNVISGDFLGQTEYAFQAGVVVGNINDLGEFTIAGSEIVNGQIDGLFRSNITATEANLLQFYTDSAQYLTIGGTLQRAGNTFDTVEADVQYLAERTSNPFLSPSTGLGTYELYTATRLSIGAGGLFSNLGDGSAVTLNDAPGTLTLDRDNHTVAATINLHQSGFDDTFTMSGSNFISAYLTDDLFGIASFNLIGEVGGFLVSGKATNSSDECVCEHLLWGYWGLLEDDDTPTADNSRAQVGVFVAGQPTLDMPLTGFVNYSGVTEAAWRAPSSVNPDGVTSYANGVFNLLVNMATGEGLGTMTLATIEYAVDSSHILGLPQFSLNFLEVGTSNGGTGFGSGIFAGPGASNLAATYRLTALDDMRAAGVIRADGEVSPGPVFAIDGFARTTPSDIDMELHSNDPIVLTGEADGFGFYAFFGIGGSLAGFAPDLLASTTGTSTGFDNPFDSSDPLIYASASETAQHLIDLGVAPDVANRLVGPIIDDGDFYAQTYWSLTNDAEPELLGTFQVAGGVEYNIIDLSDEQSLAAFALAADPVRFSHTAFSTVGRFEDSVDFVSDFTYFLDGHTIQTPLLFDFDRGRVFLANKVAFGDPTNLTSEYVFSVGVVAGTFDATSINAGTGEAVFGTVGLEQQNGINSGTLGFAQAYGQNGDRLIVAAVVDTGDRFNDPVTLDFVHIGTSTSTLIVPDYGAMSSSPSESNLLLGATIVAANSATLFGDFSEGEALSTRLTHAGTLNFDRLTGEVTADFRFGTGATPPTETIDMGTAQYQSAYLNDENYGIASRGFNNEQGGFLVSGKAVTQDDSCVCAYLHWGYWAVLEDSNGLPQNAHSSLGVYVAGQPTISMPIAGSATYEGVVEAAWRQSTTLNPSGLVTFAQGSISHTVQFATGVGTGTMDLGPDNFNSSSIHTPGQAQVDFSFTGIGTSVGRNGIGNGIFTGPNADNLGVVLELSGPNGFSAAGAIRADRIFLGS